MRKDDLYQMHDEAVAVCSQVLGGWHQSQNRLTWLTINSAAQFIMIDTRRDTGVNWVWRLRITRGGKTKKKHWALEQ